MIKCIFCGNEFHGHYNKRLCSKECKLSRNSILKRKYLKQKGGYQGYAKKECVICENIFKPITSRHKTCSDNCKVILKRRINNRFQKKYHQRQSKNPDYLFKRILLRSLRRMIKKEKIRSLKYINYTREEFIKNMESKFLPGMNWNNYGAWHIDHIRPLVSFQFMDENGEIDINAAKQANELNNLQPLWARDNLSKHKKYGGEL